MIRPTKTMHIITEDIHGLGPAIHEAVDMIKAEKLTKIELHFSAVTDDVADDAYYQVQVEGEVST